MGEKVKIDERWRIVIPSKFRKRLKPKDELMIEERGYEIVLRKVSKKDFLKEFNEVKLFVNEELKTFDAERGKHKYGGYKE
ncbi:MAG: AbrB/MazE/SpoVT family DNA-binding domain-containing protein [Candidatus Bathyarchaeia archaeon]|nr:AbrB/MazE/SpoVT family DNA-binding domain-containing protein [Candidatus Bathyarchaeota archaeon]